MKVSVTKPKFSDEFTNSIARGTRKGAETTILSQDFYIYVLVKVGNRIVGKFIFEKEEPVVVLTKEYVFDREYSPFEFAISQLTKFLKKTKIKYILYGSDIIREDFS